MRGIIAGSVGLALGLGVVPARAADAPWRPPAAPPTAAVWGAPQAAPAQPRPPLASLGVPMATLEAPRAAGSGPALDPAVRPAAVVTRAQDGDERPLPAGPLPAGPGAGPLPPGPLLATPQASAIPVSQSPSGQTPPGPMPTGPAQPAPAQPGPAPSSPASSGATPSGPPLSTDGTVDPQQLRAPRPLPQTAPPAAGPVMSPVPNVMTYPSSGPVTSAPGVPVEGTPYAPTPCATCADDLPPLPGGAFCCDGPAAGCGSRWYVSGEYLLWWTRGGTLPPLITTGPEFIAPGIRGSGIIGEPGTRILYGGGSTNDTYHNGARFNAGYWLDACESLAIDGNYFFLGRRTSTFAASSDQFPVLARPYVQPNPPVGNTSEIVAFPGEARGSVTASVTNSLWGADLNLRRPIWVGCRSRVDLLGGFRFVNLDEELTVAETSTALINQPNSPAGQQNFVQDRFAVSNQFYGGQIGAIGTLQRGRFNFDLVTKVALGTSHEVARIDGMTSSTLNGVTASTPGGLLALSTNSGHFSADKFAVVPEVGFNIGYQVTPHVKVFAGYSLLYWSRVLRAGDQVDMMVDTGRVPSLQGTVPIVSGRPLVPLKETDFWAQGVNLGVQFKW